MEFNVTYCKAMAGIGDRIKMARTALGMTQEKLAEKVGVETPSVSRWESGISNPRPRHIPSLAKALEKRPDWFLQEENKGLEAIQKRIKALEDDKANLDVSSPSELRVAWGASEPWRRAVAMFFLTGDQSQLTKDVPEEFRKRLLKGLDFYKMSPKSRTQNR